jgi:hypothetical protein
MNTLIDGDFDSAQPFGPPRFIQPFERPNTSYVLEQEFVQLSSRFSSLALNTPHNDYPSYLLVKESPTTPVGVGECIRWTRTYAQTPSTRSEPSTLAYQFIGFFGIRGVVLSTGTAGTIGRLRFTKSVTATVKYDYFLTGVGQAYLDATTIPVIAAQKYYTRIGTVTVSGGTASFTGSYTAGSPDDVHQGIPTDYIADVGTDLVISPTVPTRATYQTWIKNGTQIVAEDSSISPWMGNIYVRQTKYVTAQ